MHEYNNTILSIYYIIYKELRISNQFENIKYITVYQIFIYIIIYVYISHN